MSEHNHTHSHAHNHAHPQKGKKLVLTIALNLLITIIQLIGGFISGSLSLISDATHNFSDVIALIVTWIAEKIANKPYTQRRTFGYKRAEIIAAIINVITIVVITITILIEGIGRIFEPAEVQGTMVMLLAGVSIIVNALSALLIRSEAKKSMNMKSAYIHLFSDMLTSIAVLVGGLLIYITKFSWIDSVISIGIALYLIYVSTSMLMDAMKIIMEFAPDDIDLEKLNNDLMQFDFVEQIHHVHLWQITDQDRKIEFHICFKENIDLVSSMEKLRLIKKMLRDKYKVVACTIEPEYGSVVKEIIIDER